MDTKKNGIAIDIKSEDKGFFKADFYHKENKIGYAEFRLTDLYREQKKNKDNCTPAIIQNGKCTVSTFYIRETSQQELGKACYETFRDAIRNKFITLEEISVMTDEFESEEGFWKSLGLKISWSEYGALWYKEKL
jgi:hypothetical protein